MNIAAIVFDLDDTLYAERDYAFSGFAFVARAFEQQLGDASLAEKRMREIFHSEQRNRVFNVIIEEFDLGDDEDLLASMIATFRNHQPSIHLYRDAEAALTRFRSQRKLGLITDGPLEQQSAKIEALQLSSRLDEIIMTAELGPGKKKPYPEAFELMASRLGVTHDQCVYVADNAGKDFVAPNRLGWLTVQIERPEGVYLGVEPAENGVPAHRIKSLSELDALLRD